MRIYLIIAILCLGGITAPTVISAADNTFEVEKPHKVQDIYFGTFGVGRTDKLSFGMGFSYAHNKNIFTVRVIANDSLDLFSGDDGDYESEVSFLYGRVHRLKSMLVSYSAGVGLVSGNYGTRNSGYPNYTINAKDFGPQICLPLEANIIFRPIPFMALGIKLFGNVNSVHSFVGAHGTISFGKFWDRLNI